MYFFLRETKKSVRGVVIYKCGTNAFCCLLCHTFPLQWPMQPLASAGEVHTIENVKYIISAAQTKAINM